MKKTIVIYGSSTGTCESLAGDIAAKLGCSAVNVQDLTTDMVAGNDNLILGTSTWGCGEVQDDWYDGIKILRDNDLKGKTIALFGCGDSISYSDTFCGGMAVLYDALKSSGAKITGSVDANEYTYDDSEAVINGKFVGLALDNDNEDFKTDSRINTWLTAITPEL